MPLTVEEVGEVFLALLLVLHPALCSFTNLCLTAAAELQVSTFVCDL